MLRSLLRPVMRRGIARSSLNLTPKYYIPSRSFSDESHWTDIFKKKGENKEGEKTVGDKEQVVEPPVAEATAEPIVEKAIETEETKQEKSTEEIKDELLATAKAKMTEYVKQIDTLKREVTKQEMAAKEYSTKIVDLKNMILKEQDEHNNLVERNRKDVAEIKKFGVGSFCKSLLEGVDTLEMCLSAGQKQMETHPNEELAKFIDGIVMTSQMFAKILAAQGVAKYESVGVKADPNLHFVTAQLPHPTAEEGEITYVIKEGYMIHDRVLRPAQVCIAAPKN